jgi:SAM-dependent methyltransferase
MPPGAREHFLSLVRTAVEGGTLLKLTLARHRGSDASLRNVFIRPVTLASGPHLCFVWRHATRDITKNQPPAAALAQVEALVGADFLDAHLFTPGRAAQLECQPDGGSRLSLAASALEPAGTGEHDHAKARLIEAGEPWLCDLGVTNERGRPREGMAAKFRQIQKFAERVTHLAADCGFEEGKTLSVVDMGCGKGYLTFAVSEVLGPRAQVRGVEVRPELVALCNRVAAARGFAPRLSFEAGTIADARLEGVDILIALHACDTATDDALAGGIAAGARLLLAAPCCQKELRPQLGSPEVLSGALRHGIFQERQAEFATDALRAQLLEWAGYRTQVLEFVSTEHTAKNLMIAAVKARPPGDEALAARIRAFAAFYGIRHQSLARQLGFELGPDEAV